MSRSNPFQTAAHCWRFALRRATADGETYHVLMTDDRAAPRHVLSDRKLFAREDLAPEDIEATCDPFLLGISTAS